MTTTTRPEICEGVCYLDTEYPGWQDEIDLGVLDLSSTPRCILGQLNEKEVIGKPEYVEGSFDVALDAMFPDEHSVDAIDWSVTAGFYLTDIDDYFVHTQAEAYKILTAEWREVIEAKRAGTDDGCDEVPR